MVEDLVKVLNYSKSFSVMSYLHEEGDSRFTEIKDELEINPNFVNRSLTRLKKKDLAEKNGKNYTLTEKGEKVLEVGEKLQKL